MKIVKRIIIGLYVFICINVLTLGAAAGYYGRTINEQFTISKGSSIVFNSLIPVTAEYNGVVLKETGVINDVGENFKVDIKLLGVIPVKQANVLVVDETNVAVLGTPFGIKMYTDGVLVSNISDIVTSTGKYCPAKDAGILVGDYIISVNGVKVNSNEDLANLIEDCGGETLNIVLRREDEKIVKQLKPVLSLDENLYRAGIWVKDSSAGIGTLTFYSPQTNTVCGLGHAVFDKDSGEIIDFSNGQLVNASIVSVIRGVAGVPGELKGKLEYGKIANMTANTNNGIYGDLSCEINLDNLTEIAFANEIKNGNAKILCTTDESGPQLYNCTVKVKDINVNNTTQNLIVEITDKDLLEKTGGIVQGMSGSPLIQDGKLIGAVTHVLVDDPTKGYAIFAENMLETAQSVAEEKKLKEAS